MKNHPYELNRYIVNAKSRAMDGNQADFKPTYQAELDEIENDCTRNYERGLRFRESISDEDLKRCRRLYEHKHGNTYDADDLVETRTRQGVLLIPRYVALISEVRKLKKAVG